MASTFTSVADIGHQHWARRHCERDDQHPGCDDAGNVHVLSHTRRPAPDAQSSNANGHRAHSLISAAGDGEPDHLLHRSGRRHVRRCRLLARRDRHLRPDRVVRSSTPSVCTIVSGNLHVVAAGSCSVTASQGGNASFNAAPNVTQIFTIGARAITVTADAKTKAYGDADPALTFRSRPDRSSAATRSPGALARAAGTAVGSLRDHAGHALARHQLHADVRRREPDDHAAADHRHRRRADQGLWRRRSGADLSGHDRLTRVGTDAFTGALTRVAGENIGTYAIQQGTLTAGANYALTYAGANLTITARAVTVDADAQTKGYGDADPALTYTITSARSSAAMQFSGRAHARGGRGGRAPTRSRRARSRSAPTTP